MWRAHLPIEFFPIANNFPPPLFLPNSSFTLATLPVLISRCTCSRCVCKSVSLVCVCVCILDRYTLGKTAIYNRINKIIRFVLPRNLEWIVKIVRLPLFFVVQRSLRCLFLRLPRLKYGRTLLTVVPLIFQFHLNKRYNELDKSAVRNLSAIASNVLPLAVK